MEAKKIFSKLLETLFFSMFIFFIVLYGRDIYIYIHHIFFHDNRIPTVIIGEPQVEQR